jgi:hypothetical protein
VNPKKPTDQDEAEAIIERNALMWHRLFNALDDLEEPHRGLVVVHRVYGYSIPYIATKLGWPPSLVLKRLWRASAELRKKLGENDQTERQGGVIAPNALVIPPVIRAAFCAIWSVEKRLPTFNGITAPGL